MELLFPKETLSLGLALFFTTMAGAQEVPELPVPKVYYDFEGIAAGTVTDKSGEGRDGTLNGDVAEVVGAPSGSTPGKGLLFANDGSNCIEIDYLMDDLLDADGGYTMSAWIKPSSVDGQHILFGQATEGTHNGIRNGSVLHQAHWGDDSDAGTALVADVWAHAAWVYDRDIGEGRIYLNGVLDGTSGKGDPNMVDNMLIIGNRGGCGGNEGFWGVADDIAVWSQVLDEDQIMSLAGGASPIGLIPGDSDADDLPDDFENAVAGNLTDLNGRGAGPGPGAGTGDFDGDGRSDLEEFSVAPNTDPTKADSDGDSLSDGDELAGAGQRPATSPNNRDTDGDGLSDGVEDNTGTFVDATQTGTNPTIRDTDGNGGNDGREVANGTNPVDANDPEPLKPGAFPIPRFYYSFESQEESAIPDEAVQGLDGGVVGGELTDGAPDGPTPNGGFNFPEDNSGCIETGLRVEDLITTAGGYTMSAWIRPSDVSGQRILFGQTQQGIHNGIRNAEVLHQAHWNSDNDANTPLEVDEWVHAAWVYDQDAGMGRIYLNGELDGEFPKVDPNVLGADLILGNREGCGGGDGYRGDVDDIAVWSEVLTGDQILLLAEGASPIGASGPEFHITEIVREGDGSVSLTWETEPGSYYAVETSTNLIEWQSIITEIPEGGAMTAFASYTDNAAPTDADTLYYRVALVSPPPLLREDFENGPNGWTAVTDEGDTEWELGTPNVEGLTTASSGTQAWGTNLAADYAPATNAARLQSPIIDVSSVSSPTLSFNYFISALDGEGGQIRFLDEGGATLAVIPELPDIFTGQTEGWQPFSVRFPSAARGSKVIIEFAFLSDEDAEVGPGWYIDDVMID